MRKQPRRLLSHQRESRAEHRARRQEERGSEESELQQLGDKEGEGRHIPTGFHILEVTYDLEKNGNNFSGGVGKET